jgi:ppGpp synthetase/RelA/SpoT-type nucleotidyltranferase
MPTLNPSDRDSSGTMSRRRAEVDWLARIGERFPEVLSPGYWDNIGANCESWAKEMTVGPYWSAATEHLDQWRQEYRASCTSDLLSQPDLPRFVAKSVSSVKDKLGRKCRDSDQFASQAISADGPPIPQIGDLVRTRIACRFIDGVEFLATKLFDLAQQMGLDPRRERQGKVEGYFAQHITISQDVIYRYAAAARQARVVCEIQLATDFGTRMWDASHLLYERVRGKPTNAETWQWDPNDPRFIANQLGHMIHLADGLLMQLRKSGSN